MRGLYYRLKQPQGKQVRVTSGHVFDLRRSSSTFEQHVGLELMADDARQSWIPEGFAHAYLVLSDSAGFLYKATDSYHPEPEKALLWNDPEVGKDWPLHEVGNYNH